MNRKLTNTWWQQMSSLGLPFLSCELVTSNSVIFKVSLLFLFFSSALYLCQTSDVPRIHLGKYICPVLLFKILHQFYISPFHTLNRLFSCSCFTQLHSIEHRHVVVCFFDNRMPLYLCLISGEIHPNSLGFPETNHTQTVEQLCMSHL